MKCEESYGNLPQQKLLDTYLSQRSLNGTTKYWGDKPPSKNHSPPIENSNSEKGLHLIELLQKGAYRNPKTAQAIAATITSAIDCSPNTDDKAPVLKATLTYLVGHMEVKGCLSRIFTLINYCLWVHGTRRDLEYQQKRKEIIGRVSLCPSSHSQI